MGNEELTPWVEKLKAEPDGKKRNEIVAELCKEKGLKIGDAWKLVKEAGFDPKAPPDGGQAKIGSEELTTWAEKLKAEPDKSKRNEIVADLCKEKGLKIGDAWKLLEEAGFDPHPSPDGGQDKKITVLASHKTEYEKYRCAGLVLTRKAENYLVTEAQLEKLKRDPWVAVGK